MLIFHVQGFVYIQESKNVLSLPTWITLPSEIIPSSENYPITVHLEITALLRVYLGPTQMLWHP